MSAAVIAIGALSPFGRGEAAFDVTKLGQPADVAIRRDDALVALGFARPFAARVPDACLSTDAPSTIREDRATHLLFDAATDASKALLEVRPGYRSERIGVVMGTSSGGMRTAERFFEERARGGTISAELARASTYFAPFASVLHELGLDVVRRAQLVTACAASTWALGLALRWLEAGEVDVAIAGGYDALGPFVAAGFECLRATSAGMPAPFRVGRDGMSLGEGAGVVAMVRSDDLRGASPHFFVAGFGASTDAVHITAPDRTGDGLARAARAALADAATEPADVELVSAHGTSTPYNDAMEARAIHAVFGAPGPVVHPFKAQIGHTLGAAGVLETLAAARALGARVLPAAAGAGELDGDARVTLLERAEAAPTRETPLALKESAAFGGANAALVLATKAPGGARARSRRPVHLRAIAHVRRADAELVARASDVPVDRVARFDDLSLLAATSIARLIVASLGDSHGDAERARASLRGGGVVVGHSLATVDINDRFYARVLARGPAAAEPRIFPPTSPNLVPGQLAILFGLTGPSAATCSSLAGAIEAYEVAHDLVAAGDAPSVVVVGLDLEGPASAALKRAAWGDAVALPDGAVALVLDTEPRGALCALPSASTFAGERAGHEALVRHLGFDLECCAPGSLGS